jgi:hypothetical protein
MQYVVTLRFQFPAWDEKDGIRFAGIVAESKSEAIRLARREAERDGHIPGARKGRVTFTAELED